MSRSVRAWITMCLLAGATSAAEGQLAPVGEEFRVNTNTVDSQQFSAVGTADGDFIVVWSNGNPDEPSADGDRTGVFGQRYDSAGATQGSEFQVNTYTTGDQRFPTLAADASGAFLAVWQGSGPQGPGIYGRRYDAGAVAVGAEFQIADGSAYAPVASADAEGNVVVAWSGANDGGSLPGIAAQRYDAEGTALGTPFLVNSYTSGLQRRPAVAVGADGEFLIAWQSLEQDGGGDGIFAQRYDNDGSPSGTEFRVNTYTTQDQTNPTIASDDNGGFIVVWQSLDQDGGSFGVFARRYDDSGAAAGSEFAVNSYTSFNQTTPKVAADDRGHLIVTWTSQSQDGDAGGIFGQSYETTGALLGTEFAVNTNTAGDQSAPAIAAADGRFLIVWDDALGGVSGQRFGEQVAPPTPTATPITSGCVGDCDGDGEVAVNELVRGVNIALEAASVDTCPSFDANDSGTVTIDELVRGVSAVLDGCP